MVELEKTMCSVCGEYKMLPKGQKMCWGCYVKRGKFEPECSVEPYDGCRIVDETKFLEMKEKAEKYDEIMARRKAHAKKMVADKSKEWLHERAVKANNARWGKKGNRK